MNSRKSPVNDSMAIGSLFGMKKSLIWILLLGAGFSLFAQNISNASIYIPPVTGFGKDPGDNEVIAQMLVNEIKIRNGVLGNSLQKADFILYGTIAPYHAEEQYYHDYVYLNTDGTSTNVTVHTYNPMLRNSREQVYIFQLILKNEKANQAVLVQNLLYTSIDTVYDFFPLLIFNIYSQMSIKRPSLKKIDNDDWRNKWLYLRASFDFPITFYKLKDDGLKAGGVYSDDLSHVQQLDNKVIALPGLTLGAEVQLLDWLSLEPNIQANWEYLNDQDFFNMEAGLQIKFPLKFIRNIMLEPYGAVVYPVYSTSSGVFDSLPMLAFGGGCQVATRGGHPGAIFLDVNYMYYFPGDAVVNNPYGNLFPKPPVIHYQRYVIGLGIGYKFGLVDRK